MRYIFQLKTITLVLLLSTMSSSQVHALFPGLNLVVQAGGVKISGVHNFYDAAGNVGATNPNIISFGGGGLLGYAFEIGTTKTVVGFDVYQNVYGAKASGSLTINSGNDANGNPNTGVSQGVYNIKMKSSTGASVMAGILMNPRVITYAKIGYEITKFSMVYSNLTFDKNVESFSQSSKGLVPSVGAALLLSPRFYVGVEGSFPLTQKLMPRSNLVKINGSQFGYDFRPIIFRVMFQVGLRFGGGS